MEGVGGSFSAGAGAESISVRGQFLARDQQLMLELLADALLRPRFESEELETSARAAHRDDQGGQGFRSVRAHRPLWPRSFLFDDHPYGRPVIGSESSLADITQQDVLDYYAAQFGADRLTLVFAGDVDSAWLRRMVTKLFGDWRKAATRAPRLTPAARVPGRRVLLIDSPGSVQTHFWIGNVGVDRRYSQRAALDLVNTLYGGRFTSILNTELRIKSGLVLRRPLGIHPRHRAGRVRHPLVRRDREHRQGTRPDATDARAAEERRRDRRDARVGARLRAGPVSAQLRNRSGLGGGAGRDRALRAGPGVHR